MNKSESKYYNTAARMDMALISLLKEKPFEYITISEICKLAEVNRSTFYLHYETILDLLNETIRYLLDDFSSYFSMDMLDIIACDMDELIFISDKYLTPYLSYVKDHKKVFCTAISHNKTFGFDDVYKRLFENIFNPVLDRFHYPAGNRQYVMMYYLNGINAIVLEWLRNDCDKPIQEVSKIISDCIFGFKNE